VSQGVLKQWHYVGNVVVKIGKIIFPNPPNVDAFLAIDKQLTPLTWKRDKRF
jgi:hypothetical protein